MMTVKWNKKGIIYCPDGVGAFKTHAARPVPLIINNKILRIFFSSRDFDDRMLPNYIDVDINNLSEIIKENKEILLGLGNSGEFDDSGVTLASIVKSSDSHYFFYTGWKRRRIVSFELSIGAFAYDINRNQLERIFKGPILHQDRFHPLLVAGSFVVCESGKYKMWYCSGTNWKFPDKNPEPIYTVFYAESNDGLTWKANPEPVIPYKFDGEVVSAPWVVKTQKGYSMWYCMRGSESRKEKHYRIGYAESKDGIEWIRLDEKAGITVSSEGWDSEMVCYPAVFNHKDETYMLYSGNGVGRDGIGYAIAEQKINIVDW